MPIKNGSKFRKFARVIKVDETTHNVWGIACSEAVDCDNEIADYEGSKKAFSEWSADFAQRTSSAGQKLSLGNIRVQHDSGEVGGKAVKVEFDDDAKQIWLGTEPINDDVWAMLRDGFLTGYSIGGRIVKHAKEDNGVIRYWPSISEVSYVDNPANPDATYTYVKLNGSIELRKFRQKPDLDKPISDAAEKAKQAAAQFSEALDGWEGKHMETAKAAKTKRVAGEDLPSSAFAYVGDESKTATWKLPIKFSTEEKTKSHVRNALARFSSTKGIPASERKAVWAKIVAAAKKHGIEVSSEQDKGAASKARLEAAIKAHLPTGLQKSMFSIARLAGVVQDIAYLSYESYSEAEWEDGDLADIDFGDTLTESLASLGELLSDMVEHEVGELIDRGENFSSVVSNVTARSKAESKGVTMEVEDTKDSLEKAGHTFKAHFGKLAAHHEKSAAARASDHEDHNEMAESHKALHDHHQTMAEAHKALHAAHKASGEAGLHEAHKALHEAHKAAAGEHHKLHKSHMSKATRCMKAYHKSHSDMSEHCKAMSENCAEPGSTKAAGSEPAVITPEAVVPAIVPATVETAKTVATPSLEKSMETGFTQMAAGIEGLKASFSDSLTKLFEKFSSAVGPDTSLRPIGTVIPEKTETPAPGLQMVPRTTNKAAAPKDDLGI